VDYVISEASFDELVSFCFDHPIDSRVDPWYFDAEVLYDPARNVQFYIELFREPRFLLERFSSVQLDQGFWAISSENLQGSAYNIIFEIFMPLIIWINLAFSGGNILRPSSNLDI
jgi:hypothetical protein